MSITASSASMVLRESRNILMSPLDPESGGAEAPRPPHRVLKLRGLRPFHPGIGRNDQLRDFHAAPNREGFGAMVDENCSDLAAIIGVDRAGRVQHRDAMTKREPRAWPYLGLIAVRKRYRDASGNSGVFAGRQHQLFLDGGEKIQTRRACCRIGGEGQILRMGKPLDCDFHAASFPKDEAIRSARRRATSVFGNSGQASSPFAVTRCTRLESPPIAVPPTSLAMIQSEPLARR